MVLMIIRSSQDLGGLQWTSRVVVSPLAEVAIRLLRRRLTTTGPSVDSEGNILDESGEVAESCFRYGEERHALMTSSSPSTNRDETLRLSRSGPLSARWISFWKTSVVMSNDEYIDEQSAAGEWSSARD